MNTKKSQTRKILDHLHKGRSVSALYAFVQWNITSLHRRLTDIRKHGVLIDSKWVEGEDTRYKMYFLPLKPKRK